MRPESGAAVLSAEKCDIFYIFRVSFAAVFCIFMLVLSCQIISRLVFLYLLINELIQIDALLFVALFHILAFLLIFVKEKL